MVYDVAIIGAGASGLMCASLIKNKSICVIDANSYIGAKIKVSGGAKCNITNKYLSSSNYLGNSQFIDKVLNSFNNNKLLEFLKTNGVDPNLNEKIVKGTYFCNSSNEVLQMFKKLTNKAHFFLNHKVLDVNLKDDCYIIECKQKNIKAKRLIVASGGLSFASLGASSIAFEIAEKFEHKIVQTSPALVGFTVQKEQFWFKLLSGVSIEVNIKVSDKDFNGSMLFTHKGCSGPVILNSSLYWQKGSISIDFLPNKNINDFVNSNRLISSALPLPKQFIKEFLNSINLEDKAISKLNFDELERVKKLKNYQFSPAGNFGYSKAEVTKGGICTDEIDVFSMESKRQRKLYFLGESLDVTGQLGGYNFQFAFASAYICAGKICN